MIDANDGAATAHPADETPAAGVIFAPPLRLGRLVRRYQRFLADVEIDGETHTAHCPNTGRLLGCCDVGATVAVSAHDNPQRRCAWTWELIRVGDEWVGIHTGRANALVAALLDSVHNPFAGYRYRREVAMGAHSRVDFHLTAADRPPLFLEVKNVNAAVTDGVAIFPDAVSARAAKHVAELQRQVEAGARAAVFYCVQRGDVQQVKPADAIDPAYGRALRTAVAAGVELYAWRARVSPEGIALVAPIETALT